MNAIAQILPELGKVIETGGRYKTPTHAVMLLVDENMGINIIGMGEGSSADTHAIIIKTAALLVQNSDKLSQSQGSSEGAT